jgi:DNA polymerase III epsilon subunit-like protein
MKTNYAIIDIETGGFSKEKNGLCELALIVVDPDKNELVRYETLVKPYKRYLSEELVSYKFEAMQVNNILMKDLEEKGKTIDVVIWELIDILKTYKATIFVGHNAKAFDLKWINFLIEQHSNEIFDFTDCIDTMILGKEKVVGLASYSLGSLSSFYGLENRKKHRAMTDVENTLELFKVLTRK